MQYVEVVKDIFDDLDELADQKVLYAQCVSSDFAMGKGIAVEFNKKFDCKNKAMEMYPQTLINDWGYDHHNMVRCIGIDRTILLVTKRHYWQKPTYNDFRLALKQCANLLAENEFTGKLIIPPLGCGLDNLSYRYVKHAIFEEFADLDIMIECRTNSQDFADRYFGEDDIINKNKTKQYCTLYVILDKDHSLDTDLFNACNIHDYDVMAICPSIEAAKKYIRDHGGTGTVKEIVFNDTASIMPKLIKNNTCLESLNKFTNEQLSDQ